MDVCLLLIMDHTFLPIGYHSHIHLLCIFITCSARLQMLEVQQKTKWQTSWYSEIDNSVGENTHWGCLNWCVKVGSCHVISCHHCSTRLLSHMMLILETESPFWLIQVTSYRNRQRLFKSDTEYIGGLSTHIFPYTIFPRKYIHWNTSLLTWPHRALQSSKLKAFKPS